MSKSNVINNSKILFIANKAAHYRLPFFKLFLPNKVTFLFTHENEKPLSNSVLIKGFGFGKFKIHLGAIKYIFKKEYSKVILLPPDPAHLVDNIVFFICCKLKKKPHIVWTERWDFKKLSLKSKISNFFHKPIIKQADKIIVPGTKSKEFILNQGILEKKIIIAPNASVINYNLEDIKIIKREIYNKYNLKNKKIILYVGRIIKQKGIQYLLDAMINIDDENTILLIVGGGDFYKLGEPDIISEIKNKIRNLNLSSRVIMTGEIKNAFLPAYYEIANVFIYPSITTNIGEAWGLSINEAMQFGLPIVTTDAVGCAYDLVKEDDNGYMVSEKNADELSCAIVKVLSNNNKMGQKSKNIIKNYSFKRMYSEFILSFK